MIQPIAKAETLTIRQTLERLKELYPSAVIRSYDQFRGSGFILENGWSISLSHNLLSCCGSRFEVDPLDSMTVEIAIFEPSGKWHIAEGMDVTIPEDGSPPKTGVFCWKDSNFVLRVFEYIAGKRS